jgi:adenylyltransferase/sulfurtransferase
MSGEPRGELARALLDDIYAHAREGYPEEVCGFVLDGEVRRCENRQNALHAEDPEHFPRDARTAYNLGAKDLFFLDRSLRPGGQPVRIIYHSHVDHGAYFSDEDVRAAAPDGELLYPVDYLVVDATRDGVRGAKRFRFEGGRFVEVESYGP